MRHHRRHESSPGKVGLAEIVGMDRYAIERPEDYVTPHGPLRANCSGPRSIWIPRPWSEIDFASPRHDKAGGWLIVPHSSGESPIPTSNRRVFMSAFSEHARRHNGKPDMLDCGSDGVYVTIRLYLRCEEIRESFGSLCDYPLLDESDESELERDRETESWNDDGRDDFRREIREYVGYRLSARGINTDAADAAIDALTDGQLDALYSHLCATTNVNGGAACAYEGDEHSPTFFCDRVVWGHEGGRWRDAIDRDAWDGYVPGLTADGKVDYHAGDVATWEPIVDDVNPTCPRCGKENYAVDPIKVRAWSHGENGQYHGTSPERADPNVWDHACEEYGCDVPPVGLLADRWLAWVAARVLSSWDIGEGANVTRELRYLSATCAARGDKRTAVALRGHDPDDCAHGARAQSTSRRVYRTALRAIVSGDAPSPNDAVEPAYLRTKSVCCIVDGTACCEHGDRSWCVRLSSDSHAWCPVHGDR